MEGIIYVQKISHVFFIFVQWISHKQMFKIYWMPDARGWQNDDKFICFFFLQKDRKYYV